jgi:hypothetical protein
MIKFGNLSDLGSVVEAHRRLNEDLVKVIVPYPNLGFRGGQPREENVVIYSAPRLSMTVSRFNGLYISWAVVDWSSKGMDGRRHSRGRQDGMLN